MPWQTKAQRVSVLAALAIKKEIVMQRLIRLREHEGHPDKPGKPLPVEEAAARAGVKYRTWQRWEAGDSVPYARNLSAIADAFGFDVGEFYDSSGDKAVTPSPFPPANADERLTRMEEGLREHAKRVEALLDRQSQILKRIEDALAQESELASAIAEDGEDFARRVLELARRELQDDAQAPGQGLGTRERSGTRRG